MNDVERFNLIEGQPIGRITDLRTPHHEAHVGTVEMLDGEVLAYGSCQGCIEAPGIPMRQKTDHAELGGEVPRKGRVRKVLGLVNGHLVERLRHAYGVTYGPVRPGPQEVASKTIESGRKSNGFSREDGDPVSQEGSNSKTSIGVGLGGATARIGKHGFLECFRGTFRGTATAPSVFGTLSKTPGVLVKHEDREALRFTVQADALGPVAKVLGFRAPLRTAKALQVDHRKGVMAARLRRG